jgi:MFS family permease
MITPVSVTTLSTPEAQSQTSVKVPSDSRRNIIALFTDIGSFVTAIYFIPVTTVLVGLASHLTDNKALIGAVSTMWVAVWYLPQLFAARLMRGQRFQKRYVLVPALIGKQLFLLFAAWLYFSGANQPLLTVWLLLATIGIFNFCDAIGGVAWFDIISRALTPRTRARVLTVSQMVASLIGILLISPLISYVLQPAVMQFPNNYALIIGLCWVFMTISTVALALVREVPLPEQALRNDQSQSFLANLKDAVRYDAQFRRMLGARVLSGVEMMAASFYLVFAQEQLKLGESIIGWFTQALVAGAIAGLALFGWLSDRFGSRRVVHAATGFQFFAPLMAFLIALVPNIGIQYPTLAFWVMVVVIALRGAIEHSLMLGFIGYCLDYATDSTRALYVGVVNTLGGVVALTPVLGGLLIQALLPMGASLAYSTVFGIAAALAGLGFLVGLRLPRLTQRQ